MIGMIGEYKCAICSSELITDNWRLYGDILCKSCFHMVWRIMWNFRHGPNKDRI